MDSEQVNALFAAINREASRGADSQVERLAKTVGWMRGMIREAACDDVPMREIAERMLRREAEHA